jgi:hypothetical protein
MNGWPSGRGKKKTKPARRAAPARPPYRPLGKPPFQYAPTADPDWVIRCAYNPISGQYDKDCQRIPAAQVPMDTMEKKGKATAKSVKRTARRKRKK